MSGKAEASGAAAGGAPQDEKMRAGTLIYTKAGLFALFSWLLWGDLCFQLFERTGGPGILGLYLQDNFRVSNFQINLLFTLIPMLMGTVMTPIISFQSDRMRTRWGRRIPYMAVTAPLLCLFAVVVGYSDDIINYLKMTLTDSSWISPMTAAILVIGFMVVGFTFFNEFVGTLYYYLFADVVPRPYMGRFMALFRVVGILTGFLINAFILPYQLSHLKAIHVAIAVIYFIGFGLMCWRVKEGEYPPVTDVTVKTTFFDKVKLYFRECFCHPIFILFYVMTGVGVLDKGMGVSGIFGLHLGQHQASAVADPKAVRSLAGTPDGRWCVTAGQDGQVKLWEKTGETQLVLRKTLPGADAPVRCVGLTPDGKTVTAGLESGSIVVWSGESEERIARLRGHTQAVRGLAISSDGQRLASAGADSAVRLWDLGKGTCLQTLAGHGDAVNCVAFSSSGSQVVSGDDDGKIIVWDAAGGTRFQTLEGGSGSVYAVCFAPALERREELAEDRPAFAVRAWRQTCWYLREVFTNDSLYEVAPDTVSRIVGEDLWVVSGGRDGTTDAKYAAVRIWDARSGKLVHALKGHKQAITSVIYKPDIRMILTGSLDSSARLWDPMNISAFAGDQSLQTYSGYTHEVVGMACQTQGKYMVSASGSGSGTLHLWDIDQGISLRKKGLSSNFFLAISLIFAYPLGGLVDRWHPLRVTMWMKILNIPFPFLNYFFHVDYMSGLWLLVIHEPIGLLSAAAQMPLAVMLLPRAKYGQFSSANSLVKQFTAAVMGVAGALVMDWLTGHTYLTDNYRWGYVATGVTIVIQAGALVAIYYYWKHLGGRDYVAPGSEEPKKAEAPELAQTH